MRPRRNFRPLAELLSCRIAPSALTAIAVHSTFNPTADNPDPPEPLPTPFPPHVPLPEPEGG